MCFHWAHIPLCRFSLGCSCNEKLCDVTCIFEGLIVHDSNTLATCLLLKLEIPMFLAKPDR